MALDPRVQEIHEISPASWSEHGNRAGFLRNEKMVNLGADVCLAFQRDKSKGTQITIDLARAAGIPTYVYTEEESD